MKVAPFPTFPRGTPPRNLDFLSIYPTLGATNAFLGLNSSLMALLAITVGSQNSRFCWGRTKEPGGVNANVQGPGPRI